ncbi:MAG: hypothetical protein CME34_17875 [Gordonia sp.]|nr:hypothetical protein [Gordonia sp. (in: high G+C Gram-positive bacteria)]
MVSGSLTRSDHCDEPTMQVRGVAALSPSLRTSDLAPAPVIGDSAATSNMATCTPRDAHRTLMSGKPVAVRSARDLLHRR